MKTLLLIDGNNLFHRAYHALPPLTDKSGENVNAVYGFSNMLIKAIAEVKPDSVACAFDTKAPTFRHVEFEAYKAQRVAPPPDLYPQLPKVKKVLKAYGIAVFTKEGYEADDILATIANKFQTPLRLRSGSLTNSKFQIVILSGDRDLLQMVDGNIKVQMPGWNLTSTTLFGSKEVQEKYGITPDQMVDYKSMTGDPSDNIPGIAGIGPKGAASLLSQYKDLDNLYKHLGEVPDSIRAKLETGKDNALAARKLVKLDTDVDLGLKINDLRFAPDFEQVREAFEELGFKSILSKLPVGRDQGPGKTDDRAEQQKSQQSKKDQLTLI